MKDTGMMSKASLTTLFIPHKVFLAVWRKRHSITFALINHLFLLFYTVVGMNFGMMVNNVHSVMICHG